MEIIVLIQCINRVCLRLKLCWHYNNTDYEYLEDT